MKIDVTSTFIILSRYVGQDEAKKPIVTKLGKLPIDTEPVAAESEDQTPENTIPFKVWERLTLKEHKQLIDFLVERQKQSKKAVMAHVVAILNQSSGNVSADVLDPNLAQEIHAAISNMLSALKSAGYPKLVKTVKKVFTAAPVASSIHHGGVDFEVQ